MLLKIALWCSMLIQLITAIVAVSMVHRTKFKISWILISLGFILIALNASLNFLLFSGKLRSFPKRGPQLVGRGRFCDDVHKLVLYQANIQFTGRGGQDEKGK
jgi:hypothetical protein